MSVDIFTAWDFFAVDVEDRVRSSVCKVIKSNNLVWCCLYFFMITVSVFLKETFLTTVQCEVFKCAMYQHTCQSNSIVTYWNWWQLSEIIFCQSSRNNLLQSHCCDVDTLLWLWCYVDVVWSRCHKLLCWEKRWQEYKKIMMQK